MDDSADKGAGEHKPQEPEAAKTPANESSASPGNRPAQQAAEGAPGGGNLPIIWSPRLDAREEIEDFPHADAKATEASSSADDRSSKTSAASRSPRLALAAAAVSCAALLGLFAGLLSAPAVAHLWSSAAATSNTQAANSPQAAKAELAELSALKANLDGAARNANSQFAKLAERLDHIERAQAEPAAKIAHMAEVIDRLEKKAVASAAPAGPETTGSVAASQPAAPAETKPPDKILQDWIVQGVRGGHALVQSRYGGVYEVVIGAVLPGAGRVEAVKRQDGQWVVVTARGIIAER
jgi:hypothetical protein